MVYWKFSNELGHELLGLGLGSGFSNSLASRVMVLLISGYLRLRTSTGGARPFRAAVTGYHHDGLIADA